MHEHVHAPRKHPKEIITINENTYYVDDWFIQNDKPTGERPIVILSTFKDNNQVFVVVRYEDFTRDFIELAEFAENIREDKWTRISHPKYRLGERMKNRYTERYIKIEAVPFAPNEFNNQYVYYIRDFSPTLGRNFSAMTEQELDDLFKLEGWSEYEA